MESAQTSFKILLPVACSLFVSTESEALIVAELMLPLLLIVVELTVFNVEGPETFSLAIFAESVTLTRWVVISFAPSLLKNAESAFRVPFSFILLAYNESVQIVSEFLI